MDKPPYVSASQIGQFLFCPLAYKLQRIDKITGPQKQNIYMLFGTAMHEALAENFRFKIIHKTELDLKTCFDKFKEIFEGQLGNCMIPKFAKPATMIMTAENMLAVYLRDVSPKLKPVYVEHKFDIQLKNYPVRILGFIDLITEDDIIWDHKCCSKTTIRDWTQARVDDSIQLTLYAVAFRKLVGRREQGVGISLLPREDKPVFKSIKSLRQDNQLRSVCELATTIQKLKEANIYYPNLENCRKCELKKFCPKR